jgi:hypothetical protein
MLNGNYMGKEHPYSPCNSKKCLVRASCDQNIQRNKCALLADYINAITHKTPNEITIFKKNDYGVWQAIMTGSSKDSDAEHLACVAYEHYMLDDPSDYYAHVEYTKYLESLPYYGLL